MLALFSPLLYVLVIVDSPCDQVPVLFADHYLTKETVKEVRLFSVVVIFAQLIVIFCQADFCIVVDDFII